MDKKRDWSWLPAQMPGVARLMRSKRAELGDDHVNLCWKRGVVDMQPGWFFAAEGALAVGTPWAEAPGIDLWLGLKEAGEAPHMLVLRDKGAQHGEG